MWQLQEFDFTIIHRPSDQHNNADAMSCIPCKQSGIDPSDGVITLAAVTIPNLKSLCEYSSEEVHASQLSDPCIRLVLIFKEADQHLNTLPPTSLEDASVKPTYCY